MAAEESTATSITPHIWWDFHPANNSLPSWTTTANAASWLFHHQNPTNSASNCDQDDVSISTSLTNASNHSGLTVESSAGAGHQLVDQPVAVVPPSPNDFIGEHVSDNHLWSHVLSSVRSNGDLRDGPGAGENLFEVISSKSTSAGIFEPACDYLKKIEHGNWEFQNSSVFNNFMKSLNGYDPSITDHDHHSSVDSDQRITKLSNLISNWSIAPPAPQVNPQFNAKSCHDHVSLTSNSVDNYCHQQLPALCGMAKIKNPVSVSCYGNGNHRHDVKMEAESLEMEAPSSYFRRAFKGTNSNGHRHHISLTNNSSMSMEADGNSPCTSAIACSRLSKPLVDLHASSTPSFRPLALSDCKKRGLQAANYLQNKQMPTRNSNGRTQGTTNEGKKKRGEETSDTTTTVLKRPKHENSIASSIKMHAPKVKLGDRITALQQIVSPFGKTDTASVLLEAIGCINFLQGQVQLLSNPYMMPIPHKDPWGSLDRKDQKGDTKADLRSRGLCLVPISCTPKVYHENTGSDYWTPAYRGYLYR